MFFYSTSNTALPIHYHRMLILPLRGFFTAPLLFSAFSFCFIPTLISTRIRIHLLVILSSISLTIVRSCTKHCFYVKFLKNTFSTLNLPGQATTHMTLLLALQIILIFHVLTLTNYKETMSNLHRPQSELQEAVNCVCAGSVWKGFSFRLGCCAK